MLPEIDGTRINFNQWSSFSYERTLLYYDGPRLMLQRSQAGQLYLAWWSDSDELTERWTYLPLSESRLRQVLSGELPSLQCLQNPEDGYLLSVDVDLQSYEVEQAIMTSASSLPEDALPRPNARLNLPVPEDLENLPSRERSHLLDLIMEGEAGRVAAEAAGKVIGNIQRLLDAIGQVHLEAPTSRGPVSNTVKGLTRLNLVGVYAGSLGLRFETDREDNEAGHSLVRTSLEALFELLVLDSQASPSTFQERSLSPRVAANYLNLLSTIQSSYPARLKWNRASQEVLGECQITPTLATSLRERFESVSRNFQDHVYVEGKFTAGSTRTLRFSFERTDLAGRLQVFVPRSLYNQLGHISLDIPYGLILQPILHVNNTTGEERTIYNLMSIEHMQ